MKYWHRFKSPVLQGIFLPESTPSSDSVHKAVWPTDMMPSHRWTQGSSCFDSDSSSKAAVFVLWLATLCPTSDEPLNTAHTATQLTEAFWWSQCSISTSTLTQHLLWDDLAVTRSGNSTILLYCQEAKAQGLYHGTSRVASRFVSNEWESRTYNWTWHRGTVHYRYPQHPLTK